MTATGVGTKDLLDVLTAQEARFAHARKSDHEKGDALKIIRETKCFKERGFKSFDAYIAANKSLLGFKRRARADQLITHAEVTDHLAQAGLRTPTIEAQTRPLTRLWGKPGTALLDVWRQATEEAEDPKPKRVKELVQAQLGESSPPEDQWLKLCKAACRLRDLPTDRLTEEQAELSTSLARQVEKWLARAEA